KCSVDYAGIIRKTWHLSKAAPKVKFIPDYKVRFPTTFSKRNFLGQLCLEIKASPPFDYHSIVFHEGAHVYLSHIGYPAISLVTKPIHSRDFGASQVDLVDEYYAMKLEFQHDGTPAHECERK